MSKISVWLHNRSITEPILRYEFESEEGVKNWWPKFLNANPHAQIISIIEVSADAALRDKIKSLEIELKASDASLAALKTRYDYVVAKLQGTAPGQ